MEKQAFSISSIGERRGIIATGISSVVILFVGLWTSRNELGWCWLWIALIPFAFLIYRRYYLGERNRRLEISDAGLFVTSGQRQETHLDWNDIKSVEICNHPAFWNPDFKFTYAVVYGSNSRRSIYIPGTCPDAEEIIALLKQRLPASVFQS